MPHRPVLLNEVLEAFQGQTLLTYVDLTLGAAGHAFALLEAHPEIEFFLGIDQDPKALALAEEKLKPFGSKVHLVKANFSLFDQTAKKFGITHFDGLLADIGVSSMQLDDAQRGMSFRGEGPLDMRMDPETSLTAAEILNSWPEKNLAELFRDFGEEPAWRKAAKTVVLKRRKKRFTTTSDLVNTLERVCIRQRGLNPLTRVFQALRIAVNGELEALETLLAKSASALNPQGRVAIISFHSLEDRRVKQAFKGNDQLKILTKKPIRPKDDEIRSNPRSRSAKMRIAERKG